MDEQKKILVVEDNQHTRFLVRAILESVGYEVIEAEDGQKGFNMLSDETFKKSLSAIFLDILMPNMTGLDLLKHLKGKDDFCQVPVLMLTTQDMAEDLIEGYQHGADYYIPKPFNRQQLLYGLELVLNNEAEDKAKEQVSRSS